MNKIVFLEGSDGSENPLASEISRESWTKHFKSFCFVLLTANIISSYFMGLLIITNDLEDKRDQSLRMLELVYHRDAVLSELSAFYSENVQRGVLMRTTAGEDAVLTFTQKMLDVEA